MRWALLLVTSVLLAGLLLAVGPSASGGESEAVIRQRQNELNELKAKIEERKRRIAQLRNEGEDLAKILAELERQRSVTTQYIGVLDEQVVALENTLASHRGRLQLKSVELEHTRDELAQSLVRYYKHGRVDAAELLLSSKSFGEIFARSHFWIRTLRKLRERIGAVTTQSAEIVSEVSDTEQRRVAILELRRERAERLAELDEQETQRQHDRRDLQQTISKYEAQTSELLASQEEIERLIAEARRTAGGAPGEGLAALQGRLPWPVKGRVVASFGTQVHPRYGTRVRQKGMQIEASEGTAIQAVAPGKVVFVGWLGGYGQTVVLDHGQDYYTLYAHASEVLVSQGQTVSAGQSIARVGSTDSLFGPGLHFEIRQGKDARDPARWLRPS
jgi:murein hydrolase activator